MENLPALVNYAERLSVSNLLPKQYQRQPANVLYAIEYGKTLGITAMAAINGIHVIEGKPTASAGLIGALVRQAGHKLRVRMSNGTAVAEIVRSDDPDYTFRSEWSIARAKTAGLTGKKVWQQYPEAMLKARAITEVARDACEEVLFGLHYTAEELGADGDAQNDEDRVAVIRHIVKPEDAVQEYTMERVQAPQPPVEALYTPSLEDWAFYIEEAEACLEITEIQGTWRKAKADGAPQQILDQVTQIASELDARIKASEAELQAAEADEVRVEEAS